MKIKLHSVTDLITNSSTTIYTFSENSEQAFKNLVTEFFKATGVEKTCDECFNVVVGPSDFDRLSGKMGCEIPAEDVPQAMLNDGKFSYPKFNAFIGDILEGKIPAPEWFTQYLEDEKDYEYSSGTTLYITAKEPKYERLAKLFHTFLYSTEARECSN